MSTRSGKRIHRSFHENIIKVDVESAAKSERKTRSKRVKENLEGTASVFKTKKRNNYVSYPTDDEEGTDVDLKEDEGKAIRSLRNNALKERNTIHNIDTVEPPPGNPKSVRTTRRTRKITEEPQEVPQTLESNKNENQKNKKKKQSDTLGIQDVTKKNKKKKKGRRSSSMIVEDIEPDLKSCLSKSNMSVDSFHSAAGSPCQLQVTDDVKTMSSTPLNHVHNKDEETPGRKTRSGKITKNEPGKVSRKRKSSSITKDTFDKALGSMKDSKRHKHTNNIKEDTDNITDKNLHNTESKINITHENDVNLVNISQRSTRNSKTNETYDKIENSIQTDVRKSISNTTFDKNSEKRLTVKDSTFDKDATFAKDVTFDKRKSIKDTTFEKDIETRNPVKDLTFDKDSTFDNKKSIKDTTFEKDIETKNPLTDLTFDKDSTFDKRNSIKDTTFENDIENRNSVKDTTFEKVSNDTPDKRKSIKDTTFEKNTSFDKEKSSKDSTFDKETAPENIVKYATFDKDSILDNSLKPKDSTFEKVVIENRKSVINTTFENETSIQSNTKSTEKHTAEKPNTIDTTFDKNSKSSLISSDNSNITLDKSDISRISITSDDSHENIINTTPVLIESSLDTSQISAKSPILTNTPDTTVKSPITLLKREGTFTKDEIAPQLAEVLPSPHKLKTPTKRLSLPSPGCTPFPYKSCQEKILNVTRSIEKRRSSIADPAPRATKVMFCSPVNNPAVVMQQRRKVIKSNLKGSNKSFVFDDSVVEPRPARKRSYTQSDAEDVKTKRKRYGDDSQHSSIDRLSRPRTSSASAKLTQTTPSKKLTPSKPKIARTKLPNFAALHQKQFDKMESLNECQERKAKRAKHLLTPTGSVTVLERISPKETDEKPNVPPPEAKKPETPIKSLPTFKSLNPGYTRFGFRLNLDVNPFTFTTKTDAVKSKKKRPTALTRQATVPSLAGTTSLRREEAKKAIMREKTFNDKRNINRNENRTIIKGVRTNRRFELQMKMRNIDCKIMTFVFAISYLLCSTNVALSALRKSYSLHRKCEPPTCGY